MVASKKTSSTSSSAKTRSKGTAAAANISKSAKENTTRSLATKKKTPTTGLELKQAVKPLQAHTPSSQSVKDAEIAALQAKIAVQKGLSMFLVSVTFS